MRVLFTFEFVEQRSAQRHRLLVAIVLLVLVLLNFDAMLMQMLRTDSLLLQTVQRHQRHMPAMVHIHRRFGVTVVLVLDRFGAGFVLQRRFAAAHRFRFAAAAPRVSTGARTLGLARLLAGFLLDLLHFGPLVLEPDLHDAQTEASLFSQCFAHLAARLRGDIERCLEGAPLLRIEDGARSLWSAAAVNFRWENGVLGEVVVNEIWVSQ